MSPAITARGYQSGFGNEFAGPPEQTYVLSEAAGA